MKLSNKYVLGAEPIYTNNWQLLCEEISIENVVEEGSTSGSNFMSVVSECVSDPFQLYINEVLKPEISIDS